MVNILFCGNNKVFDGMLTCALSILKRTQSQEPFTFYVYTMDVSHIKKDYLPVSDAQMRFFEDVIKQYGAQNRAVLKDVTQLYAEEFGGCPNEGAYCSPYTLIRLFADRVEGMPDKLLYLDIDIMFNRDIHLLYDENVIAHLSDKGYDEQLGARPLRRVIQRTVEDQLSEQLLMGSISLGDTVRIRVEGNQLVYEREEHKNTETVLESNETKA
jgi:lipopolysaccharide biosynthesis glycosyltransferase